MAFRCSAKGRVFLDQLRIQIRKILLVGGGTIFHGPDYLSLVQRKTSGQGCAPSGQEISGDDQAPKYVICSAPL
jgi:hypothetical protein